MQQGMTKRQALLAILGAAPVMAYAQPGEEIKPRGFRMDASGTSTTGLMDLRITLPESGAGEFLFLRVTVNGKEEVRVSIAEAIRILKGAA